MRPATVSAHSITLDDDHIYRRGDGVRVPGVTEVLRFIEELDGIPLDVLARAARFGRNVHMACDLWNSGVLDEAVLDPALRPYLEGWQKFCLDFDAQILHSELLVYHPTMGYAGTLDAIADVLLTRGRRMKLLIDIKTSALIPRTVGPQTAAYRTAYHDGGGGLHLPQLRYCVHLKGEGKYTLQLLNDPADINMFMSCLNIHKWREKTRGQYR
jgi:hypothetical protein